MRKKSKPPAKKPKTAEDREAEQARKKEELEKRLQVLTCSMGTFNVEIAEVKQFSFLFAKEP